MGTGGRTYRAPTTYDPTLMRVLYKEHDQLCRLLELIRISHGLGDYPTTVAAMHRFRSALHSHVLKENVQLYSYLQRRLAHDIDNMELMQKFQREMHGITRVALTFLKRYVVPGALTAESHEAFIHDTENLTRLLAERMKDEERVLYPMYS